MRTVNPNKQKLPKTTNPVTPADLLASPLFFEMSDEPELLDRIVANSQFIKCDHNYKLLYENGCERALVLVHSGCVRVSRWVNEKERVISYEEAGNFIGELNLLNDLPHSADVFSEGDMTGIEINPETFLDCLPKSKLLYRNLARCLAATICASDTRITKRQQGNYRGRPLVALAVEDLITLHGFQADDQTIDVRITHEELADNAEFSRGTASAAIKELVDLHILTNEDQHIKVLDRDGLSLYTAGKRRPSKC